MACAREIGVTHFHGDLVRNRIHGVVEVNCANPIGARREEVENVAQENDLGIGRTAGGGHGIQREGEEDDAARTVHTDTRVAHAAGFAGNRLEQDGGSVGAGCEGVREIRAIDVPKAIIEAGIVAVIEGGVHPAGDGVARSAKDSGDAEILVAIGTG